MSEVIILVYCIVFAIIAVILIGGGIIFIHHGIIISFKIHVIGGLILITIGSLLLFIAITVQLGYATLSIQ